MRRFVVIGLLGALSACGGNPSPNPPDPNPPTRDYAVTITVFDAASGQRVPGPSVTFDNGAAITGNEHGVAETRLAPKTYDACATADHYQRGCVSVPVTRDIRRDILLTPDRPPLSRLRTDGRFFVNDGGTYRGLWTSALSLLAKPPPERAAFLDWAKATGFDGVRVFAGDLGWANQTPDSALANLPAVLEETQARSLYLYLVAITGSVSGYDVERYLSQVAQLCAGYPSCVLEGANEIGHSSQSSLVNDVRAFESVAVRVIPSGQLWALGAMLGQDEPIDNVYPPTGVAPFSTAHLNRDRQPWPEMIRRVREIAAISEVTGKPAISGEPIGAAEVEDQGRRSNLPELFYTYGALCRLFELGACVFHAEDGLQARPLAGKQQEAAEAFLAGFKSIDSPARLGYRNAGWAGPDVPVASFTGATRVYSGVTGNEGYVVVVGDEGVQVEWKNGYHVVAELGRQPGVIVWRISK